MNATVPVVRVADLLENKPVRVIVDGEPIAVVRSDCGIHAIADRCSHADVALSEGDVDDCTIECWLHGSAFDLRTGAALSLPAFRPVATYAVEVVGEGDDAVVHIDPTPRIVEGTA